MSCYRKNTVNLILIILHLLFICQAEGQVAKFPSERLEIPALQKNTKSKVPEQKDYHKDKSGIIIYLYPPGELLITDSLGRKTGYDPRTGIEYTEIPYSSYNTEGASINEVKRLIITRPADGEYTLEVIGTDEGNYGIEMHAYDQQGGTKLRETMNNITISLGTVHSYILKYSKTIPGKVEFLKKITE